MQHADRQCLIERYEAATAIPMIALSIAFVALLIYPIAVTPTPAIDADLLTANWLLWGLFATDYLVRFALARHKLRFVRTNLVDLAVVVLPLLAPLRIFTGLRALRILRAFTVISALAKANRRSRSIVNPQSIGTIVLVLLMVIAVGAALELEFERGAGIGNIKTYGDSLWWAVTTVTTVGYGDRFPVTSAGRGIAAMLMFVGIGTTSLLAATLTTVFLGHDAAADTKAILARLEAIEHAIRERGDPATGA